MRILFAGESHGKANVAIIEGMPKGVRLNIDKINDALKERQAGYGRGKRMSIESDSVVFLSGLRNKINLGSPIALMIKNSDQTIFPDRPDGLPCISLPRPGHADLAGMRKYGTSDARDILERASARETCVRVAAGAVCEQFLEYFGIDIAGHVLNIGGVQAPEKCRTVSSVRSERKRTDLFCLDRPAEKKMISAIDRAAKDGDTLGGLIEILGDGIISGLGSHAHYDQRMDSVLAANIISVPAIKGVEFGAGFSSAFLPGSKVHDPILADKNNRIYRKTNNSGGIEGGMSNGSQLVVRCVMKPIPTLLDPLQTVDYKTCKKAKAAVVRSDVCAVSACAIVTEKMTAIALTDLFLRKFGSDSFSDIKRNYNSYKKRLV